MFSFNMINYIKVRFLIMKKVLLYAVGAFGVVKIKALYKVVLEIL